MVGMTSKRPVSYEATDVGLGDTDITDTGVKKLGDLPNLREVFLSGTKASRESVELLKKRLATASITF